jgi:hypothetical protein
MNLERGESLDLYCACMKRSRTGSKRKLMKKISVLSIGFLLIINVGCQKESTLISQDQVNSAAKPVVDIPTSARSLSSNEHSYVLEKNGEYGYRQYVGKEASDVDTEKRLLMVRYLGKQNGEYAVLINADSKVSVHVSCRDDCEMLNIENRFDGQSMGVETLTAAGTVEDAIMQDAKAGLLKPYK